MSNVTELIARAQAHQRAGELPAAAQLYQEALRHDPAHADAHEQFGMLLAQLGQLDQAVAELRQASQLQPGSLAAQGNLGNILRFQGKLDEAAACYRRVLELQPNSALAHNDLGLIAAMQGRFDEAIARFRQAIALHGEFVEAHTNLATTLAQHGKLAEAIGSFRRAAELRPNSEDAHGNLGAALANLGQLDGAIASCRRALELKPDYAPAWFNLGIVYRRQGNLTEAAAHYRRAIELGSGHVDAHKNLALVLRDLEQLDEAAACCRRALALQPEFADAHHVLGTIWAKAGRLDEAVACYRRAGQLNPRDAEIANNLGLALAAQNKLDDALAYYEQALELRPDFADAHANRALALAGKNRFDGAIAGYRRAIGLRPDYAEAHNNLAVALTARGRIDEAVDSYRRALQLRPDLANAHYTLAGLLARQGDFNEAAAACRKACELQPQFAEAHHTLGAILAKQGDVAAAEASYRTALALKPTEDAWRLSLIALCPAVFASNDEIDRYRENLLVELARFAEQKTSLDPATLVAADCRPAFNLQFQGRDDRPIREAFAKIFRRQFTGEQPPGSGERPRIGFVVTDRHEQIFLKSLGGVLERMNTERFELVVAGSTRGVALMRPQFRSPAIKLVPMPDNFEQAAQTLRDARCDLLYYWEVATDSTNYFLPFLRLAPVQCTSWGIQVTSGIPRLDYYLSSSLVEVPQAQQHYSEKLVLARTLLTFQRRIAPPAVPKPREYFGLSAQQHVYLCAQQLGKFQPDFDPIVADILRRDRQGVVVATEDRNGRYLAEQLRRRIATTMPDVADRVVFQPFQPTDDYFSLIAAADVLLDPLHFGGVNSTYDAFSLNRAIVTLPSQYQRGRYTLGCYQKMGLHDCVAKDAADYVRIAVALGTDAAQRSAVESQIRDASPVLFDDAEAVSEHERIFSELIEAERAARQQ